MVAGYGLVMVLATQRPGRSQSIELALGPGMVAIWPMGLARPLPLWKVPVIFVG